MRAGDIGRRIRGRRGRRGAGVDARPGIALADRIVDVLGDTEIVLLVDNCEHVLDPTAELVQAPARPLRERPGGGHEP